MRFYPFGSGSVVPTFDVTASMATYAGTASSATVALHAVMATFGGTGDTGPVGACNYLDNGPTGTSRTGDDNYKGPQGVAGTVDGPFEPTL